MSVRSTLMTPDGVALAVDDAGGGGRIVVFQHGLTGDAGQTAELFPDNPAWRRITLECRGHGRSQLGDPARLTIPAFADDVAQMIATRDLSPLAVGGISTGAAMALRLAVKRPALAPALILVRPAWLLDAGPQNMRPMAAAGSLLRTLTPAAARAAFEAGTTAQQLANSAPDNLKSLLNAFNRPKPEETAHLLVAISASGPEVSEPEVRRIAVPTLVIACDRDAIHPRAHAEALAALIPAARLVTVTAKSDDHAAYVRDCRAAIGTFLKDLA